MDLLSDITLTGDYFKRPTSLKKLTKQFELSNVAEESLEVYIARNRINALIAERQIHYLDEQKNHKKQPNQDAVLISQPGELWHVGVADGVGGLPYGEIASTQALRFIHHYFQQYLFPDIFRYATMQEVRASLEGLLRRANRHLNHLNVDEFSLSTRAPLSKRQSIANRAHRAAATTMVGAFAYNAKQVVVYSIGDSGVALVPHDKSRPILYTKLHSTFEQAIRDDASSLSDNRVAVRRQALHADFFTASDGREFRDLLTSALGGGQRRPRRIFVGVIDVEPGDNLFLFSDGLMKIVGKTSDYAGRSSEDMRMSQYGRVDELLEFFSQPNRDLRLLLDKRFRAEQHGPDQLLDDTAI
jgi:serine/threonine protein phosphatase PrpC